MKGWPIYNLGSLEYEGRRVEFYYPAEFRWSCEECGACCRDLPDRKRKIVLTDNDIEKIKQSEKKSFYEKTGEYPFTGVMKMKNGKCVFLDECLCEIYDVRALICRTYPFWIERNDEVFMIRPDMNCQGIGKGHELEEGFFRKLLKKALEEVDY